jgi:hypothetical protein
LYDDDDDDEYNKDKDKDEYNVDKDEEPAWTHIFLFSGLFMFQNTQLLFGVWGRSSFQNAQVVV